MTDYKLQTQEAQRAPSRLNDQPNKQINKQKLTLTQPYYTQTVDNERQRENIERS